MKKLFVLFVVVFVSNLTAQDLSQSKMFSTFYLSVLGGTNFNTLPTAGAAFNIELKTNVSDNLNAKLSIGYSSLYDDDSYEVKSYRLVSFDNYSKYHTRLFLADRVKYSIIPVTLGAEYFFTKSKISPFGIFEVGYNISSSTAEGTTHDGIAGTFDTVGEVPEDYRQTALGLDDGSSFNFGIGAGIKYMLTEKMDLNLRYVYRYNDSIINNNQILIGITF